MHKGDISPKVFIWYKVGLPNLSFKHLDDSLSASKEIQELLRDFCSPDVKGKEKIDLDI